MLGRAGPVKGESKRNLLWIMEKNSEKYLINASHFSVLINRMTMLSSVYPVEFYYANHAYTVLLHFYYGLPRHLLLLHRHSIGFLLNQNHIQHQIQIQYLQQYSHQIPIPNQKTNKNLKAHNVIRTQWSLTTRKPIQSTKTIIFLKNDISKNCF